jgi:heterodisulfide reductase subunit A
MMDAGRHPLIKILTLSELVKLEGTAGDFIATIRRNPRYVDEELCTACGNCTKRCPVVVGNEFDMALKARKAIYRPFPQSVPAAFVIDKRFCVNKPEEKMLTCWSCVDNCERGAIRHDQKAYEVNVPVGAVIVATGFDEYDPYEMRSYGYGIYENVLTSLEFERMVSATSPTAGHILRPSDRLTPKRIVFIQCVGSRGETGREYCSRYCCMNAIKDCILVKQHDPDVESMTVLYTDLRSFGRNYDSFVQRSREILGVQHVRGRPAKITEDKQTRSLTIYVEDTESREQEKIPADMVVLSSAAVPNPGTYQLARTLGVQLDHRGFFRKLDDCTSITLTGREGIFVAGSAGGPMVIPECVASAGSASALAQGYLQQDRVELAEEEIPPLDTSGPARLGVFVCSCGANIAGVVDVAELVEYAKTLPGVAFVSNELFACSAGSQEAIQTTIKEHNLNRIVVAACTPRTHEPVFRQALAGVGLNPFLLEMANIRDQVSWVHTAVPEQATEKARDLIRMAVARARLLSPLEKIEVPVLNQALVVGGGVAGMEAAGNLARLGFQVTLVEKTDRLGGTIARLGTLYPTQQSAIEFVNGKIRELETAGVKVLTNTQLVSLEGFLGNFHAVLDNSGSKQELDVSSIIVAIGAGVYQPQKGEFGWQVFPNVTTSLDFDKKLADAKPGDPELPKNVAFIQCVGSRVAGEGCNPGCSRYCCPTAIKQALELRRLGANVAVFYRSMRAVSAGAEELYRQARGEGVLFLRFDKEHYPQVLGKDRAEKVLVHDALLDQNIEMDVDLVILSVGMVPREPETTELQLLLKTPRGTDGFLLERHPELAPVETTVDGVFICGAVQGAKDIADSVAQAGAAASKAAELLAHRSVALSPTVCVVNDMLCRGCGKCAEICQFGAPELMQTETGVFIAQINPAKCKGCGTCAVWCPSGAITAQHFTDGQIEEMLSAMFEK